VFDEYEGKRRRADVRKIEGGVRHNETE